MAVCIKCSKSILYGCPRCMIFSDTMIHVDCLGVILVVLYYSQLSKLGETCVPKTSSLFQFAKDYAQTFR
jgi:hypothetical protein